MMHLLYLKIQNIIEKKNIFFNTENVNPDYILQILNIIFNLPKTTILKNGERYSFYIDDNTLLNYISDNISDNIKSSSLLLLGQIRNVENELIFKLNKLNLKLNSVILQSDVLKHFILLYKKDNIWNLYDNYHEDSINSMLGQDGSLEKISEDIKNKVRSYLNYRNENKGSFINEFILKENIEIKILIKKFKEEFTFENINNSFYIYDYQINILINDTEIKRIIDNHYKMDENKNN